MHAHAEEVLRAGLLVETHQVVRVPLFGLPSIDQILVADLGGMAVSFAVVEVLGRPCMYMLRAYQSPSSIADCGPQCAQMPNLASRNQSGIL